MFIVKVVDKATRKETVISREYEQRTEAERYYRLIKSNAIADKESIIRPYNEELEQEELRYVDIILFLLENDKEISRFMIS